MLCSGMCAFIIGVSELLSEAVKLLKGAYVVRAIEQLHMDRAIIFCRTKLDCDNLEQYFIYLDGGNLFFPTHVTVETLRET